MNKIWMAGLVTLSIIVSGCGTSPTPTKVPPTLTPIPTNTPLPTATPSPIPTARPTAVPTPANPGLALSNAYKSWSQVKSLRVKTTRTGGTSGTQLITVEVVTPNKQHLLSRDTSGQVLEEMYVIGSTFYLKVGSKWTKTTMSPAVNLDFANPQKITAAMGPQKDVKFVGAEVLDGIPTLIYQYITTQKYAEKVWIGIPDNLPRKLESQRTTGGPMMSSIYYDYNADISIVAPM